MELIIFDCDGVLVDSEPISARCLVTALRQVGVVIDEAEVLERFLGISDVSMRKLVEEENGRQLPADFLDTVQALTLDAFAADLEPIAGVVEAVAGLELAHCVASSSTPARIRRSLEITNLLDHFAPHIFSATMVRHGKPAPDLFLYVASNMDASPSKCMVIEDSEAGVCAAKAAGMTVLGFTGGSHVTHQFQGPKLEAAGADLTFDSMVELPDLLRELG